MPSGATGSLSRCIRTTRQLCFVSFLVLLLCLLSKVVVSTTTIPPQDSLLSRRTTVGTTADMIHQVVSSSSLSSSSSESSTLSSSSLPVVTQDRHPSLDGLYVRNRGLTTTTSKAPEGLSIPDDPRTLSFFSINNKWRWLRGGASLPNMIRSLIQHVGKSEFNCWVVLFMSIVAESFAASLNKYSKEHGSVPAFAGACVIFLMTVFGFNLALAKIEVGVAYACWSALGTLIVNGVGIFYYKESCNWYKLSCLFLITSGVVGLNLKHS